MKIGILTYHRAHNFGALLQAMATRITLERMGHDAYFVDYWPEYHAKRYRIHRPPLYSLLYKPLRYFRYLQSIGNKKRRINRFEEFILKYIQPYCKGTDEQYDAILYGSDQIWRKQKELGNFNDIYFASHELKAGKYIAFSASTDKIPSNEDYNHFQELLSNFTAISVREKQLLDLCCKLGFTTDQIVDPTFLLTGEEWVKHLNIQQTIEPPYALYYIMKQGVFEIAMVREFVKERGLRLKVLHGYNIDKDDEENISIADPRDMVSLIYNAQFVITTSFHGLAFAINLHKEFVVSTDFGMERIKSLLDLLGLQERFIDGKQTIEDFNRIDYDMVVRKQNELKNHAIKFIERNIW